MKKIYMIGLGGSIQNANTETHSMQFVFAENIECTYEQLKTRWYGDSLHIDGYAEFKYIDNYEVDYDSKLEDNLYMVVYGGYKEGIIDELHTYSFVRAYDKIEAKSKAKEKIHEFKYMDHVDEIVDVFSNVGMRFGLKQSNKTFKDNNYKHTFIKLKQ